VRFVSLVFVVEPSPKSQNRLVIVPLELSVKLTVSGQKPLVGCALKLARGTKAPLPMTALVLLPAVLVVKTTTLLKGVASVGAKLTTILVEPEPARLKGVPDKMVKGPSLSDATPPVRGSWPRLVATKLVWTLEPTATMPKLKLGGDVESLAGLMPEAITVFVVLPPLLVKTTTLLKLPTVVGAKDTATVLDPYPATVKGLPLRTAKESKVAALPVRVRPPVLSTWKFSVLVRPRTTGPKSRLVGLIAKCGGGSTVVTLLAELLAGFGSAAREETVTLLVAEPSIVVLTRMVMLARAPFVIVSRLQVTTP